MKNIYIYIYCKYIDCANIVTCQYWDLKVAKPQCDILKNFYCQIIEHISYLFPLENTGRRHVQVIFIKFIFCKNFAYLVLCIWEFHKATLPERDVLKMCCRNVKYITSGREGCRGLPLLPMQHLEKAHNNFHNWVFVPKNAVNKIAKPDQK